MKGGTVMRKIGMKDILSLKNKNILGINPPVHDFSFFDLWSKPLGLLYLLRSMELNGNAVALIDCVKEGGKKEKTYGRAEIQRIKTEKPMVYRHIKRNYYHFGITEDAFISRLKEFKSPDLILLTSGMTYWYGGVKWSIDTIRRVFPNTPIVLGGIYACLCPAHAASLAPDFLVTENWIPNAPYPAMELYGKISYGVAMTSFGCPLFCDYCASAVLWPEYFLRGLDTVKKEIDYQVNLGAADIAFYDDALLLDKENRIYPLCSHIKNTYGGNLRLHTPNGLHVRQIDDKCACVLKESGFVTIRLSLESIDTEIQRTSSDKVRMKEYESAVLSLRKAGYTQKDCETYILAGLPNQDTKSVMATINFVKESGGSPKLAEFSPIPGTKSFKEAIKKIPELESEPLLQNNTVYSSWISGDISESCLQELKDMTK